MFILREVTEIPSSGKKGAVTVAGKPNLDIHPEILNSIFKQAQITKIKK